MGKKSSHSKGNGPSDEAYEEKVRTAGLVLALLYLTSWTEGSGDYAALRSWRSYDWDALDALWDADLISGNRKNKSVWITREGEKTARQLVESLNLDTSALEVFMPPVPDVPKQGQKAYRLNVRFDFEKLSCWRELVVPAEYTFFDLHIVLQTLFNWLDYHVYNFELDIKERRFFLGEVRCFEPDFFDETCEWRGRELVDLENVTLEDVFERTDVVHYTYDWGDNWDLTILLLGTEEGYPSADPRCEKGAGDCPPDDVGGEGGFEDFLKVIADQDDPEHWHLVEWGEGQGFEHFDLGRINKRMPSWRRNKAIHLRNRAENELPANVIPFEDILASAPASTSTPETNAPADDEYEAYERACKEREMENDGYLREFGDWLKASGLKDATIRRHIDNVGFFLNVFLLREDAYPMQEGCSRLDEYFGYFFIYKCMWSTPGNIKTTAASIKKFYKCMRDAGRISEEDLRLVTETIKGNMAGWQDACRRFNDGSMFD
ncbi:DUF6429 family protein [Curtanaerobium respiraculi]|uniref:DUF6429 family protein n=1 Tax=Curtanaerobium respiraculi TaxID=2949669 RepID=UPI0024B36A19|nr:DUF6429 family protein [Curtanaerobium respiraculi]